VSENHRYISPSEITKMDCWRAYRWYREGIKPRRQPKPLNAGTAWDAFMGEWFRPVGRIGDNLRDQRSIDQRLADGVTAAYVKINAAAKQADATFLQLYGEGSSEVEAERTEISKLIEGMALHFADTYIEDEHGVCRAVQVKVDAPLPSQSGSGVSNRYRLHGYIDRIMEHEGRVLIIDDKSTSSIEDTFFDDFENDLQMPLYAYGLPLSQSWVDLGMSRGVPVDGIGVFAAAKKLPAVPGLRKTPFPVYARNGIGEIIMEMVDGEPKPVQATEPVPCDKCGPTGTADASCKTCLGTGLAHFASGARKGEMKTSKVTRVGISSLLSGDGSLNYTTTLAYFEAAIDEHGLDRSDYIREINFLHEQGLKPFFQLASIPVTPTTMQEATEVLRAVAPLLDKVPDAPMRNKFRCRRCSFQQACVVANPEARASVIKTFYSTREEREEQRRLEAEKAAEANEAVTATTIH